MKDRELRDMLEKGGVIYQKGDKFVSDGCKDFNRLWSMIQEYEIKLDMLLQYLDLEIKKDWHIENKIPSDKR